MIGLGAFVLLFSLPLHPSWLQWSLLAACTFGIAVLKVVAIRLRFELQRNLEPQPKFWWWIRKP